MANTRVLVNSAASVASPAFTGSTGEAADLVSGVPVCTVTREDGTALTAAVVTAGTAGDGVYYAAITTTHTSALDWLTLVWTGTTSAGVQVFTQTVEVVGGFYASIPELRALPGLSSSATFSAQQLRDACSEFEDLAERFTGQAWVPRFHRERLTGRGTTSLLLSKYPVRSVLAASSVDTAGTATSFTVTNWVVTSHGSIVTDGDWLTSSTYGEPNLWVSYEHGEDQPPPLLRRACREWVAATLLRDRSQVSRAVLSQTDPDGFTQRFGTVDWNRGRPTGIESVDMALNSLGTAAPAIA